MRSQKFIAAVLVCLGLGLLTAGCQSGPTPKNITTIPGQERPDLRAAPADIAPSLASDPLGAFDPLTGQPGYFGKGTRDSGVPPLGDALSLERLFRRTSREALFEGERETRVRAGLPPRSPFTESIGDELWVIYRPEGERRQVSDDYPGTGSLMTKHQDKEVPLPLAHTDVKASIQAYIATVNVTQQFENPFDAKIEAVYVFPLPENSAVNEFLMVIGQRRIRGIIREREEAEQIYQEAKRQGYTASLLTQERPNIFTQSVANIEPGKRIDINIKYYHTLAYDDGWYEFVFPMVVGPRFNPPGHTKGIGAVGAHPLSASVQPTDVHYLRPDHRSGHDIAVQVDIAPGVEIEEVRCKTHTLMASSPTSRWQTLEALAYTPTPKISLKLDPGDTIPNKDLVVRYRVAGNRVKSSLITHHDERGGFFTLMLYPPHGLEHLHRAPLELVFVLDCSGSMNGAPIQQAKSAVEYALKNLRPGDSFQLINFSNESSKLGFAPLEATPENIRSGLRYLASLNSEGGTMMIRGIQAALDFPHDPNRLRFVCFLTDGYVGNESEILQEVHRKLGDSRIFAFGVGSSPNRFLLDSMAKIGRGAVAYLGLQDDGSEVMQAFFDRISHPAMTDVKIDWGNLNPSEVYPRQIPDLFVGRPVIITGKFEGRANEPLKVHGRAGGEHVSATIAGSSWSANDSSEALPSIWARLKITDLLEQSRYEPGNLRQRQIRNLALDYQLMSPFTAFVALDASRRTAGDTGVTLPVAVPVPEGVNYETTVAE